MNKEKSIAKQAWEKTGKKYQYLSVSLCIFALISIFCFIGGYFAPLTLILTVPFLMIPSFFAVTGSSIFGDNKKRGEGLTFFAMFRTYFSPLGKGAYRVIIGLLFGFLAYVGCSLILSLILNNTILVKDAAYIEFVKSIETVTDINKLYEMISNFMNTNTTFNNIIIVVSTVSTLVGVWVFIHHIAVNNIKYFHNMCSKTPLPIPDLNLIHKFTMKNIRGSFYKDYYKALWFFLILIPGGMAGGLAICKFLLPNLSASQSVVVGLFTMFILILLFIPYYLNVMELLYKKYANKYIETFVNLSLKSIEQIKKSNAIDPNKEKELIDFLNSQKNNLQSKNEEKDDKSDSENK